MKALQTRRNKLIFTLALFVVALILFELLLTQQLSLSQKSQPQKNISYEIEGKSVLLHDGLAQTVIVPGSSSMNVTTYIGDEAYGDLDGDGRDDVAFFLTQDGGGSGTFYYLAVAYRAGEGYVGTNAIFLGDRIVTFPIEMNNGIIRVRYLERAPTQSFSSVPSIETVKLFKVVNGRLVAV